MVTETKIAAGAAPLRIACAFVAFVLSVGPSVAATAHNQPRLPSQVTRGAGKSPVSLNVDNAPIKAVLHILFRKANQSYVLGPRVTGTVTASLKNIPFDAALRQILSANSVHLTEKMVNGIYVINGPQVTRPSRRTTIRATSPASTGTQRQPSRTPRQPGYRRRGYYQPRGYRSYTVPGTASGVRVAP